MKIYRLEVAGTNKGPFSCSVDIPQEWREAHFAPHDERNISYQVYKEWLTRYHPSSLVFSREFHFGFLTLAHLNTAFEGWQDIENLVLIECEINITQNEDFLILSDGQVMYRKLISKTDITSKFRTVRQEVEQNLDDKFLFKLVSPTEVRKDREKEIRRHLEGFIQYLQHQVNKGFRNAAYRNDLNFTINLNCTLKSQKHLFDQVVYTFCKEMLIEGWIIKVTMDEQKYTLDVSDDVPF